jgi:hypothetical protein
MKFNEKTSGIIKVVSKRVPERGGKRQDSDHVRKSVSTLAVASQVFDDQIQESQQKNWNRYTAADGKSH